MRRAKEEEWKKCLYCGKIENQIKVGHNPSGTQRCKCKECGKVYTIDPKGRAYLEEVRKQAMKTYFSGVSGRGVGKIYGMNKSNVMNWIKKRAQKMMWKSGKSRTIWRRQNWMNCTGFLSASPTQRPGKTSTS